MAKRDREQEAPYRMVLRAEWDTLVETCKRKTEQIVKVRAERDAAIRELGGWSLKAAAYQMQRDDLEARLRTALASCDVLGQALAELQARGLIERIRNRPPRVAVDTESLKC